MSVALRKNIVQKVIHVLRSGLTYVPPENVLVNALRIEVDHQKNNFIHFKLPLKEIFLPELTNSTRLKALYKEGSCLVKNFPTDECIAGISLSPVTAKVPSVYFSISSNIYINDIVRDILQNNVERFISSQISTELDKNVVVEFSSPNIAKPFHVGHLRSTIHGNFISNLHHVMGFNVTRLNYLGDWGTQFGLLQYGLEQEWFKWEEIQQNPIGLLLETYIRANSLAEIDESVAARARVLFQKLEEGDEDLLKTWNKIRRFTVNELSVMYNRLGIKFDQVEWESQYGIKEIREVLACLESHSLIETSREGKKVAKLSENKSVPLVKSDGSSLYLARDIAAAIDRYNRFKFHRMYYVVDNAQTDHFFALKQILLSAQFSWADYIEHVKFGRINGMSTRKGTAVFLTEVLDEGFHRMRSKQLSSTTTKANVDLKPATTHTLALSAIFIQDLKQRRKRDYTFDWDEALKDKGDTGVFLQYAHCRLSSLERTCKVNLPENLEGVDLNLIKEPEIVHMLAEIGRFPQVLLDCREQLESCILVRYLFDLSHSINSALKTVQVRNEPVSVATARLAAFSASKRVLGMGLKILGVTPLEEM